jgi:DegV family protein with EDD domain
MPADFAKTYGALSEGADAIVSIHLPTRVSGTYNAALQGIEIAKPKYEVHVVDSFLVSVGLGIIAMAAARVAKAGGKLAEVLEEANKAISQTQIRGLLDTLHYLLKGGRITKVKALVGTLLNVKPILTMRQGEIVQAGMARSYTKGIERLFEFVKSYPNLQEVAISHSTVPEEAKALKKRIASIIDEERIQMSRIGAGLGVHGKSISETIWTDIVEFAGFGIDEFGQSRFLGALLDNLPGSVAVDAEKESLAPFRNRTATLNIVFEHPDSITVDW